MRGLIILFVAAAILFVAGLVLYKQSRTLSLTLLILAGFIATFFALAVLRIL